MPYNRSDTLHICHVEKDKLENGTDSIVEVYHRFRGEVLDAYIDNNGFFRDVWQDRGFARDHWRVK